MRLKLLSCEIFYREFCFVVARSPHTVDIEFLPKGLHDIGSDGMRARLQAAIDRVEEGKYDAILLGYGLCNNGLVGLIARKLPLVVPRAHDCITVFLGSARRYEEYFHSHPGVYFKTTGWIERAEVDGDLSQLAIGKQLGIGQTFEDMVAKYGEDNARFLWDQLGTFSKNYSQFTFIEMGVEPNGRFEERARQEAAERGWKFEKLRGDLGMVQRLVDGVWEEKEFLVVPAGSRIVATYDGGIIAAERTQP
jgi:hypothetical protein